MTWREQKFDEKPWEYEGKGKGISVGSGPLNDFLTVLLHLNWLDYVFIAIIVYATLSSASRGIITEAINFIGLVVAIFASGYLSAYVALAPGDLVYSGTPDGVAAVVKGDRLHGHVDGLTDLSITIG